MPSPQSSTSATFPRREAVAGVDFAPPEPIASVLPRIQLTRSQAEELWALVCKGRRRNPNNDDDAAMAKEIFEAVDLTNAVQWALQSYVRHVIFLSDVPQFRRRLKTLQDDVTRFLATLPQEHDPVRSGLFVASAPKRAPRRSGARSRCLTGGDQSPDPPQTSKSATSPFVPSDSRLVAAALSIRTC
jgi:hypothetical protein